MFFTRYHDILCVSRDAVDVRVRPELPVAFLRIEMLSWHIFSGRFVLNRLPKSPQDRPGGKPARLPPIALLALGRRSAFAAWNPTALPKNLRRDPLLPALALLSLLPPTGVVPRPTLALPMLLVLGRLVRSMPQTPVRCSRC